MTRDPGREELRAFHPVNKKGIHDAMDFTHGKVNAFPGNFVPGTGAGCCGGKER